MATKGRWTVKSSSSLRSSRSRWNLWTFMLLFTALFTTAGLLLSIHDTSSASSVLLHSRSPYIHESDGVPAREREGRNAIDYKNKADWYNNSNSAIFVPDLEERPTVKKTRRGHEMLQNLHGRHVPFKITNLRIQERNRQDNNGNVNKKDMNSSSRSERADTVHRGTFKHGVSKLSQSSGSVSVLSSENKSSASLTNVSSSVMNINNQLHSQETLKKICGPGSGLVLDLVIVIISHLAGFHQRQALRDTWLSPYTRPASRVRYFFLIGQKKENDPFTSLHEVRLLREVDEYKDLVRGSVSDSYLSLTHKTLLAFQLIVKHCRHARHVLKADHDVWLNTPALLRYLTQNPITLPVALRGFCTSTMKPIRDPESRYYVPKGVYPNRTFPPFCHGPGYVTTPDVAARVLAVSSMVPFLQLEDVFVGLCLFRLGLKVRSVPELRIGVFRGVRYNADISRLELCQYRNDSVILRHEFSVWELRDIWNAGEC